MQDERLETHEDEAGSILFGPSDLWEFRSAQAFCCSNTPLAARGDGWYPTGGQMLTLLSIGAVTSLVVWLGSFHFGLLPWNLVQPITFAIAVGAAVVWVRCMQGERLRGREEMG